MELLSFLLIKSVAVYIVSTASQLCRRNRKSALRLCMFNVKHSGTSVTL